MLEALIGRDEAAFLAQAVSNKLARKPIFRIEIEEDLVSYLLVRYTFVVLMGDLPRMAFILVESNGIKIPFT